MRIINRQEFLGLPDGTLYSEYQEGCFHGLKIKAGSVYSVFPDMEDDDPIDFYYQNLVGSVAGESSEAIESTLDNAEESGADFSLDFNCIHRDGSFDRDMMYAIYSPEDVACLVVRIFRGNSEPVAHTGKGICAVFDGNIVYSEEQKAALLAITPPNLLGIQVSGTDVGDMGSK